MLVFHSFVLLFLVVSLLTVVGNAAYLRRTSARRRASRRRAFVSVLVPARDEEARLGACLESLADQDYPAYEVVVLDDNSTDRTRAVADSFAGRILRLRVLDGAPLETGWIGKPYACMQLGRAARGEWLLFTDADVVHGRTSLTRAVAAAEASGADLFTVLPEQEAVTLAEKLKIPLLYFAVAAFLPMFFMDRDRSKRMAAASGQFLLFRRGAYGAIGGHEAVRADVVDDVGLSRAIRAAGMRLVIANGVGFVRCRMYTGWREIVEGFSKNFFAGIGGSVLALVALLVVALSAYVVPFVALAVALVAGSDWRFWAVEVALALATRFLLARVFAQPLWPIALHPVSIVVAMFVALRSFWLTRFAGGVRWKGRRI